MQRQYHWKCSWKLSLQQNYTSKIKATHPCGRQWVNLRPDELRILIVVQLLLMCCSSSVMLGMPVVRGGRRIWEYKGMGLGFYSPFACGLHLRKHMKIYLYFLSFLTTEMAEVCAVEILTYGRQGPLFFLYDLYHCQTSNISRTLAGNKIVDHSDVVGASPVSTAPTASSFLT